MDYANELAYTLRSDLFRVTIDTDDQSFNKKIRNAITHKNPNIWIIGEKEVEDRSITWRRYCSKDQHTLPFDKAHAALQHWRDVRAMDNFEDVAIPE
jgi:threonyl-tRNA synthetase